MKFALTLALVAVAVAATDAQRKLAFAPDYKGPACGDMLCPDNYEPVCGSDGVTYSNECNLGITSCNEGKTITKVGDGACPSTPSSSATPAPANCPDACLDVYEPVTDENGKEYSNECYMQMAKCQEGSTDNGVNPDVNTLDAQRKLAFAPDYKGPPCGDMLCPDNYAPVCGSDGVTYSNECNLGITSCNQEKNITKVGDGACPTTPSSSATPAPANCPDACLDVYRPVTDENGKQYSNECYMQMAKCQKGSTDNGNYELH